MVPLLPTPNPRPWPTTWKTANWTPAIGKPVTASVTVPVTLPVLGPPPTGDRAKLMLGVVAPALTVMGVDAVTGRIGSQRTLFYASSP